MCRLTDIVLSTLVVKLAAVMKQGSSLHRKSEVAYGDKMTERVSNQNEAIFHSGKRTVFSGLQFSSG